MRFTTYLLAFLLPWGSNAEKHEFHLSKCALEYNESEKALQFSLHLFTDDLEEALRRQGIKEINYCTQKEATNADEVLNTYLQEKLSIQVNGQAREFVFIGKEPAEDILGMWVYLEIEQVPTLSSLNITNAILMEAFSDQKNIISIKGPGGKKSALLFQKGQIQKSVNY
ncbi:MAG TPA: hypothetical protein PKA00_08970 [Saprospiraceae bacterium]|nr:hypothetical protein [Saprospiraceae bacterium]HMQ83027.1 hypothetical protein [Saprospiraceae bacterium]